jgi:hypothetical protein
METLKQEIQVTLSKTTAKLKPFELGQKSCYQVRAESKIHPNNSLTIPQTSRTRLNSIMLIFLGLVVSKSAVDRWRSWRPPPSCKWRSGRPTEVKSGHHMLAGATASTVPLRHCPLEPLKPQQGVPVELSHYRLFAIFWVIPYASRLQPFLPSKHCARCDWKYQRFCHLLRTTTSAPLAIAPP